MKSKPRLVLALFVLAVAFAVISAAEQPLHGRNSGRRMNVADLRQAITAAGSARHPERELARRLAGVELTERLSLSTLHQLSVAGPENAQALQYLADASAFLELPDEEIPSLPRPEPATQKAIVERAIHYVARTLAHLPNFLATRVTQQLVSADAGRSAQQTELIAGFYLRNIFRASVTYQNGKETEILLPQKEEWLAAKKGTHKKSVKAGYLPAHPDGLVSQGEFGPMLAVILLDAAKGKLRWAHWEEIGGKPVAAFQFGVDRTASHFTVSPWQVPIMEFAGTAPKRAAGSTDPSGGELEGISDLLEGEMFSPGVQVVAYHGQIAIDPETGSILRIAVEAEPLPQDTIQLANILVEYASVKLGNESYVCPVHSVAISRSTQQNDSSQAIPFPGSTNFQLNDVRFIDYHRFGSQETLLVPSSQ